MYVNLYIFQLIIKSKQSCTTCYPTQPTATAYRLLKANCLYA